MLIEIEREDKEESTINNGWENSTCKLITKEERKEECQKSEVLACRKISQVPGSREVISEQIPQP